ncbi:probable nucleoredoxin 2 [Rutidosis leptorrhynchoides]|uniref:probable nucleoredoxin 2 n=1 Tax=Rutidosis leptorrhynchoides TaxID=125765 RepID=UPI003A9912C0
MNEQGEYEGFTNGDLHSDHVNNNNISTTSISSLLASNDRDFLLDPHHNQVRISNLEDKVIGIYFSANWYYPCKNFTQVLIGVYEQLKGNGSNFEVVFVSSDENSDAFNNYRASMPWLAIPFSDLETKKALDRKFHVEGIPCLVILQPGNSKEEVVHNGVELVYKYGAHAFPFTTERLDELLMEEKQKHASQNIISLLTNCDRDYLLGHPARKKVPVASIVGKTIGLYFSAQWCLPGVKFTPKLISVYQKIKQILTQEGKNSEDFEIVFVSNDRNEEEFNSNLDTTPWLTIPFGDPTIKSLAKYFDIQGIPCLVILDPDGKTLTMNGRNLLNLYKENAYPFTEAKLELIERHIKEESVNLPRSVYHEGHRHELSLVSEDTGGGPFICCDCDEQGYGWAYLCLECGYEVHPKCVGSVKN